METVNVVIEYARTKSMWGWQRVLVLLAFSAFLSATALATLRVALFCDELWTDNHNATLASPPGGANHFLDPTWPQVLNNFPAALSSDGLTVANLSLISLALSLWHLRKTRMPVTRHALMVASFLLGSLAVCGAMGYIQATLKVRMVEPAYLAAASVAVIPIYIAVSSLLHYFRQHIAAAWQVAPVTEGAPTSPAI